MLFIGIDPGVTGGWAIVRADGSLHSYEQFIDWKSTSKTLVTALKEDTVMAALEKVHSMPRDGGKSAFTFGANFGGWLALLESLNVSHALVPPQTWQKAMLGSFPKGESKARALEYVSRRYPDTEFFKSKHGINDAVCIALYCRSKG